MLVVRLGVSRSLRGVVPPTFAEAVDPTDGDGDGGARARLVPLDTPASLEPADVTLAAKAACCRSKKLAMVADVEGPVGTRSSFGWWRVLQGGSSGGEESEAMRMSNHAQEPQRCRGEKIEQSRVVLASQSST